MHFQDFQRAFTAHIRDPQGHKRPAGVPARRMRAYNTLLFNNVESFLLACFPVCRKILGARRWKSLVRQFFRDYTCQTPYFREIPGAFLGFLQTAEPPDLPAFLPELAHYEWIELALETAEVERSDDECTAKEECDLLDAPIRLNPVLALLAYRYPVHRLSPRFKPAEPPAEATFIAACRDVAFEVRFVELNAATARLLEIIQSQPALSGRAALRQLASQLGHADPEALLARGRDTLAHFRAQGIILGRSS